VFSALVIHPVCVGWARRQGCIGPIQAMGQGALAVAVLIALTGACYILPAVRDSHLLRRSLGYFSHPADQRCLGLLILAPSAWRGCRVVAVLLAGAGILGANSY